LPLLSNNGVAKRPSPRGDRELSYANRFFA